MKKLLLITLLVVSSAPAETRNLPKTTAPRPDVCAPIGRTAKGELVYAMDCQNLPAPPPPPQAETREADPPPSEPETRRTGLFGWSMDRR